MRDPADLEPLVGKMKVVTHLLGCSASTVRRRMESDPSFPKPFRDRPTDDWEWLLAEIKAYVLVRAAQHRDDSPEGALTSVRAYDEPQAVAIEHSPAGRVLPDEQNTKMTPGKA